MNYLYEELKLKVADARRKGKRLIFVDECLFSSKALLKLAYSNRRCNIELNQRLIASKPIALVAGVSSERGLEGFQCYENSLNAQKFSSFLESIIDETEGEPIAIFMDNLRVHHSLIVKDLLKAKNTEAIFNVPYSP